MKKAERVPLLCTVLLMIFGAIVLFLLSDDAASLERKATLRRETAFAAEAYLEECKARAAAGAYMQPYTETAVRGDVSVRCSVARQTSDAGVLYSLVCDAWKEETVFSCETALYVPFAVKGAE